MFRVSHGTYYRPFPVRCQTFAAGRTFRGNPYLTFVAFAPSCEISRPAGRLVTDTGLGGVGRFHLLFFLLALDEGLLIQSNRKGEARLRKEIVNEGKA